MSASAADSTQSLWRGLGSETYDGNKADMDGYTSRRLI